MPDTPAAKTSTQLLQNTALGLGVQFDAICREHGLRYSLAFGSLIGAVRHHGFIPWDDDLDFLMPRPDYERFVEVAAAELPPYYRLQNYRVDGSKRYVTRLVDMRLTLRLQSYETNNDLNPWIDIFPLDGAPEGAAARKVHGLRILWHKAMCAFASFSETVNQHRPGRPRYQQLIIDFCRVTRFGSWMDIYERLDKYDRALKRYAFDACEDCVCGVGTYDVERQTWPRAAFERLVEYDFEGVRLMGAADFDAVLAPTYGDYMTLPPEDQRLMHEIEVFDAHGGGL